MVVVAAAAGACAIEAREVQVLRRTGGSMLLAAATPLFDDGVDDVDVEAAAVAAAEPGCGVPPAR